MKYLSVYLLLTLCSTVFAQDASLVYPLTAVANEAGEIFVADRKMPGLIKISDSKASAFFQAEKKFRTPLNAVRCVEIDREGNVLAGDSSTREVYRFDAAGKPTALTKGFIGIPMDLAVDSKGRIYVSDLETHRIYRINPGESEPEEFLVIAAPRGLAIDEADHLWILQHGENAVVKVTPEKEVTVVISGRPFQFPHDIAFLNGQVYVTDGYGKCLWKFPLEGGVPEKIPFEQFDNPVGISTAGTGEEKYLLITDPRAKKLFRYSADGQFSTVFPAP